MEPVNLPELQRRARFAYEKARFMSAFWAVAPWVVTFSAVAYLSAHKNIAWVMGGLLLIVAVGLQSYGRDAARSIPVGVAAGMIPLIFSVTAEMLGFVCSPQTCHAFWVPACFIGGNLGGALITRAARGVRQSIIFWISASIIALLTGDIGCACIGYAGTIAMVVGYAISFGSIMLFRFIKK